MAVVAEFGHSRIHDDYMERDPEKVKEIIRRASRIVYNGLYKQYLKELEEKGKMGNEQIGVCVQPIPGRGGEEQGVCEGADEACGR